MSDDLPLGKHPDRAILEAMKSESRGLRAAIAAIDGAAEQLRQKPAQPGYETRVPRTRPGKWSDRDIQLATKMNWDGQQAVVLVRRHKYIKALVRKLDDPNLLPGTPRKQDNTCYVDLPESFRERLELQVSEAFASGGRSTADGWVMLERAGKT